MASVQPLATQAGLDALKSGGNAIDAAAAVALTLGVVDGHNSGIGGGCFFLARLSDGTFIALDGRETAPSKATRDMYLKDGEPVEELKKNWKTSFKQKNQYYFGSVNVVRILPDGKREGFADERRTNVAAGE